MNQGRFLDAALQSIFSQELPIEVFVQDGGSSDNSLDVIKRWAPRLAGWTSGRDGGQSEAINCGIAKGTAPFVCWLNSDDLLLPGGLQKLHSALQKLPEAPFAYGRTWDQRDHEGDRRRSLVFDFGEWRMAQICIVSQPGTLMRRSCWEALGGVDTNLNMAMDYDLWWRAYRQFGTPAFVDDFVAVNRVHDSTKTNTRRKLHYEEAMGVLKRHYGRVPLKWYLAWPYAVWWRSLT